MKKDKSADCEEKPDEKMVQIIPRRKMKDSVFIDLFQNKRYLIQLYKTLHPEDESVTEDDLEDITIKHVIVDADYNDLGFSVRNRLIILVESQSTWTYNIIIRALMYMVQTYHEYFKCAGHHFPVGRFFRWRKNCD